MFIGIMLVLILVVLIFAVLFLYELCQETGAIAEMMEAEINMVSTTLVHVRDKLLKEE